MTAPAAPATAAPERHRFAGALLVAGAACCFGAISTLAVLATRPHDGRPGIALETALFWRYVLAAAALWPLALAGWRRRGGVPALGAGGWARAVALSGLGQVGVAFLSISAVRFAPVATVGFLFYTFPVWVLALAAVRGTERLDRTKLTALALSLAGIACTVGLPGGGAPGGATAWPGVALALTAAVLYALYIPYLGGLQARLGPTGAGATVCAGAAVLLGVGALARGTLTAALAPTAWAAVATLALLCTVLAFVAFMRGLGLLGPVRTAIVSTVEPFFTAVLGAAVLAQPAGPATFVGGTLIAAAVLLVQRPPRPASGLHRGAAEHDTSASASHEVHV